MENKPLERWVVFDTETSGLPNYKAPADDPSQPRLAAISMIQCDAGLGEISVYTRLIKPDGWVMEQQAMEANGLTMAILEEHGVPVQEVLDEYTKLIDEGFQVAAYGAQFDCKIMRGELRRANMDDRFDRTKNYCIMSGARGIVVKPDGKRTQPKLVESVAHFKIDLPEMEGPKCLWDAHAALGVMRALRRLAIRPIVAEVHRAKEDHPALLGKATAAEEQKTKDLF